jgi:hypothetical protein
MMFCPLRVLIELDLIHSMVQATIEPAEPEQSPPAYSIQQVIPGNLPTKGIVVFSARLFLFS